MNSFKLFWILALVAVFFAVSSYYAAKRLAQIKSPQESQVIVINESPVHLSTVKTPEPPPHKALMIDKSGNCVVQEEFKTRRLELSKIISSRETRERKPWLFLKKVNDFRLKYGLPLPVQISEEKLKREGVVYNNCRTTCRGNVHEVFVSQVLQARAIQVLTQGGELKELKLHDSGIELASLDELDGQGIPYRSWLAPVSSSDWSISGPYLYYSLDIQGLWLKVDSKSRWWVSAPPKSLTHLKKAEEPLAIPGCHVEEECFESEKRHFKAPRICQSD